jgi:uncharacterized protein
MNQIAAVIFVIAIFLFSTFLNWYFFQAFKTLTSFISTENVRNALHVGYWILFQSLSILLIVTFLRVMQMGKFDDYTQMMMNVFLTVTVTQLVVVVFLFGEDIVRNFYAVIEFIFKGNASYQVPDRSLWLSILAIVIASIPFWGFVYGILYGKHNFKVKEEVIYFEELPTAFDGFRIAQISDIHSGSFKDKAKVQKGVNLLKAQGADMVVFTGDLVNNKAEEIEPFLDIFKSIEAPFGKYSILGNHDYGDYFQWPSVEAKVKNFTKLKAKHELMGFRLLLDEHVSIVLGNDKIQLLGVENWGIGFKSKGDLNKALEGVEINDFKILLSHDPSHWDEEVKKESNKIHLTLSGHTHGMQFGIETPIFRWSPVQYRYPNWAGLSEFMGRYLYVNRGFGFHAFSGRVGIWPEITVIELRKK